MTNVTIIGGGLGGLVAAITAREQGHEVVLHEAKARLGGRARSTDGPHQANWGPHVVYADGVLWDWLAARGLAEPARRAPRVPTAVLRVDGRRRRVPPLGFARGLVRVRRGDAPVDRTFHDWASEVIGDGRVAAQLASFMGVATFHHDPGSLSAGFVAERVRRATSFPPSVRYLPGGWGTMVDRLAARAGGLGVRIETSSAVDAVPTDGPVVVATTFRAASALLGTRFDWPGARTALLDLGLRCRRGDAFLVGDLDESGWAEAFSVPDPSLAPAGEHLVQAQIGMRPGETLASAVTRAEALVEVGFRGWRERVTWRRQAKTEGESGAVDLPGTTWRDRPAIDRGDDVYLVGDSVAAPGLLGEVSVNAAVEAIGLITRRAAATFV